MLQEYMRAKRQVAPERLPDPVILEKTGHPKTGFLYAPMIAKGGKIC